MAMKIPSSKSKLWLSNLNLTVLVVCFSLSVNAYAGVGFTLVANEESTDGNEENTKDMSVNFITDLFDSKETFAGLTFNPVIPLQPEDDMRRLIQHNSGVLDVSLNLLKFVPLTSASLLQFSSLKQQLVEHCWDASQANQLTAKLRLYVIPPTTTLPNGHRVHNRLNGTSPHGFVPPTGSGDFAPASMPVAVYRQNKAWSEGDINMSFLADVTLEPELLLDVQRAGVVAPGTVWEGITLPPVDLCLNRIEGAQAVGLTVSGVPKQATLCYDSNPDWEPWMEWDVTEAVRFWLQNNFDPASYHGFSIFQSPHDTAEDQTRMNNLTAGNPLSRGNIAFASSSAVADCGAAAGGTGVWLDQGIYDFDYFGTACRNPDTGAVITPVTRPQWRPQLIISDNTSAGTCSLAVQELPEAMDAQVDELVSRALTLKNNFNRNLIIDDFIFSGSQADRFTVSDSQCRSLPLEPEQQCTEMITMAPLVLGVQQATLTVSFHIEGEPNSETQIIQLTGTGSTDADGISDNIENQAPNDGDGNADGVPDREQVNVASLLNNAGQFITVVSPASTRLQNVRQVELVASEVKNTNFDHGFYGFDILDVPVGDIVDVQIVMPDNASSRYFKFGPSPENNEEHWYDFIFDGNTGAIFDDENKSLTLFIVDGGRGDSDLQANGKITDPGGFGVDTTPGTVIATDATVGSIGLYNMFIGIFCIYLLRFYRRREQFEP